MFPMHTLFGLPENATVLILFFVIVIWSIALVTIANSRFNDNTTKICWFLIILFLSIIGILLFMIWGRRQIYQSQITKHPVK